MKTLLQYLFALALVILGIVLLASPSRPTTTTCELQSPPDANSQVLDRPAPQPLMRLA